jgi:hypothetical protein
MGKGARSALRGCLLKIAPDRSPGRRRAVKAEIARGAFDRVDEALLAVAV